MPISTYNANERSGSGKTQFLLTLLLSVQLAAPKGLSKRAIYLSTEAPLSTPRLSQILASHPYLSALPASKRPNLTNILSITAMDLETQDHILAYQLPVAVQRYNVGLVIIDSITSNYRAEHTSTTMAALSTRSSELAKLGQMLRNLAASEDIAVVVANQVSDRFTDAVDPAPFAPRGAPRESGVSSSSPMPRHLATAAAGETTVPSSPPAIPSSPFVDDAQAIEGVGDPATNEILSLLHQQRFFTGWGDKRADLLGVGYQKPALKTPALGLVWSSQVACRVALKKEMSFSEVDVASSYEESSASKEIDSDTQQPESTGETGSDQRDAAEPVSGAGRATRRTMKLVMAPWTAGAGSGNAHPRDEMDFRIWKGGLSSR